MRINQNNEGVQSPSIYIGIPSLDGRVESYFTICLLQTVKHLESRGIKVQVEFCTGHFVSRARNILVSNFLKSDCTHILMIDSDQGWDSKAVYEMIKKDKEFIAGAVPIKDPNCENYALKIYTKSDGVPLIEDGLIPCERVGCAFSLIKRSVFGKLFFLEKKEMGYSSYFEETYDSDGRFWGEDLTFCKRWKKSGGSIYIYPDIDFIHVGKKEWKGNYFDYLCSQPGGSNHKLTKKHHTDGGIRIDR